MTAPSEANAAQDDSSSLATLVWSWLPWIALVVSMLFSLVVFLHQRDIANEEARLRFSFRAKEVSGAVRERLATYESLLQAGTTFLRTAPLADRNDWQRFVAGLHVQKKFPGIQGMGFARHIPASALQEHEDNVRAAGFPEYSVRPAGTRAEYTSIIWLEPFDWRNQRAFGYDMFAEPTRRAAMERARDTGEPALTRKVKLVQETSEAPQAGFLIYLPLYRYLESPQQVAQRRDALMGYIYAPFRMNDLMDGIFGQSREDVDLEIFDGDTASADSLMFDSDGSGHTLGRLRGQTAPAMFEQVIDLDLYGHRWRLHMASTDVFEAGIDQSWAWGFAAFCLVVGLLVFQGLRMSATTRGAALLLAERMTSELAEREARLRALFESIHDAVIVADGKGTIESCNPATAAMFGTSQEALIGSNVDSLMPAAYRAAHHCRMEQALASGRLSVPGTARELSATRSDGSEFPIELSLSLATSGGERRFVAVVRDISERRRIDEELRQHRDSLQTMVLERTADLVAAKVAAESANRAKTDFLANISHELRTPMHAILSFASLGRNRQADDEGKTPPERYFANIDSAAQRLMRLLDNLLDLSRIEAAGLTIKPAPRRIAPLIDEVLEEIEPQAGRKGLVLRSELAESGARVNIDGLRIGQVLRNLLNNALRFTSSPGQIVIVGRVVEGARMQITVRDSGVGIPPDELESIFDKFVQSSRTHSGAGGTGLGLAICREIVAAHGGRIWAENNASGGASFHFTLPLASAPATADEVESCEAM